MNDPPCSEMELLVQADVDGELDVPNAAKLMAHLSTCPACSSLHDTLASLSGRLRGLHRHAAPAALRAATLSRIRAIDPPTRARPARLRRGPIRHGLSFAGGLALAASVALLVLPRGPDIAGEVLASHVRALQPGHLTDVPSTDQHTVKPWFDGRLDYAPFVPDLAAAGFPLIGGRLDYVGGRPVAALIYTRRAHVIDVYAWPASAAPAAPSAPATRNGYHYVHGHARGFDLWAISDLDPTELADFARRWEAATQ